MANHGFWCWSLDDNGHLMDPNGIFEWDLPSGVIRRLENLLYMEDGLEHHRTKWQIFQQAMELITGG